MYLVSDEQIEFILNNIKQRGVEMEDLQNNLLDHICCILEQELTEEQNFEIAYEKVIKQFFNHALWEIEEETILLLKYKNYYKMKRFLYILLFVSIGYNIFVLSKLSYDSYKQRQQVNEWESLGKITLEEGFADFIEKVKTDHPEKLTKEYYCVNFIGDPMSDEESEWSAYRHDTAQERKAKLYRLQEYNSMDSVAGIYNKNIVHFFAFRGSGKNIDKHIQEHTPLLKNITLIKDQRKLLSGLCNEAKTDIGFVSQLVVIDKKGKLVYRCKYLTNQHIFLSKFLKTLTTDVK